MNFNDWMGMDDTPKQSQLSQDLCVTQGMISYYKKHGVPLSKWNQIEALPYNYGQVCNRFSEIVECQLCPFVDPLKLPSHHEWRGAA